MAALKASFQTLRVEGPDEIARAVVSTTAQGHAALVLFHENKSSVHEAFLDSLVNSSGSSKHVLIFHGEATSTADDFYNECCRVMPAISGWFGRNLDAFDEILRSRGLGLSRDGTQPAFWIWRNAHVLFSSDRESFKKILHVMVSAASRISRERADIAPVALVVTGLWEVMGDEASKDDSFLFRPSGPEASWFPKKETGLIAIRVVV